MPCFTVKLKNLHEVVVVNLGCNSTTSGLEGLPHKYTLHTSPLSMASRPKAKALRQSAANQSLVKLNSKPSTSLGFELVYLECQK